MGDKERAKAEKKRLKAQAKLEKARAKSGQPPPQSPPSKWYRDPNWIRAIVAIASLAVMIITLLVTIYF